MNCMSVFAYKVICSVTILLAHLHHNNCCIWSYVVRVGRRDCNFEYATLKYNLMIDIFSILSNIAPRSCPTVQFMIYKYWHCQCLHKPLSWHLVWLIQNELIAQAIKWCRNLKRGTFLTAVMYYSCDRHTPGDQLHQSSYHQLECTSIKWHNGAP